MLGALESVLPGWLLGCLVSDFASRLPLRLQDSCHDGHGVVTTRESALLSLISRDCVCLFARLDRFW